MSSLVGTPALLWLAVRRDRVLLPVWIGALALMGAFTVRATVDLYDTTLALRSAARGVNESPALVAMYGPIPDETSLGAVAVLQADPDGRAVRGVPRPPSSSAGTPGWTRRPAARSCSGGP